MTRFLWVMLTAWSVTLTAWAQWQPALQTKVLALNQYTPVFKNMGFATFWGGLNRQLHFTFNDGDTIAWKTPLFKQGHLPLYFSEQKQSAPLVVMMPGIFGTTDTGLTPHAIDRFEKAGAHVMVVPNIVSNQYVHAYPLYAGDLVETEAQVMEAALEFVLGKIGSKVTKVHVVAESLGTIVGSVWTAWDVTHKKRIHSLTLLAPPQDLSMAMVNFDEVIKEYTPDLTKCSRPERIWSVATKILFRKVPLELPLQQQRCLASLVIVKAFMDAAQKAYLAHAVTLNDPSAYEVKNFEDFFRRYRPEMWSLIESKNERLRLSSWVKKIRQHSSMPLRLLSSHDDFLNRGLSWADFLQETGLPNDHLILLDWGGHSGYLGADEMDGIYRDLIDSI